MIAATGSLRHLRHRRADAGTRSLLARLPPPVAIDAPVNAAGAFHGDATRDACRLARRLLRSRSGGNWGGSDEPGAATTAGGWLTGDRRFLDGKFGLRADAFPFAALGRLGLLCRRCDRAFSFFARAAGLTTPLAMQVSLEHRPGSVVELAIEVPTEQVERAIQRAIDRLAPRVRVAGFRPGKAPREILEREIGWPALREQALEILLPETLSQAVTEHQLQAIDTPQVEVETFERLLPARFRARVTVKPEVILGDVAAIRAPLREAVVGSDRVDAAIGEIRESFASLVPADNRPVRDRDHVVVDLEVRKDGVPVDEQPATNVELDVSSENLLPGLFEGVEGMSQGESREIPVHLPDDYRRTELAGQDVIFAVTVKEIKERQLPDADDELARLSGLGENIEELRQKVEERLHQAAERDEVFAQQKAALDALVESSKLRNPLRSSSRTRSSGTSATSP